MAIVLIALLAFLLGWGAHAVLMRAKPSVNPREMQELVVRRDLDSRLLDISRDHIESEAFAAIVLDEIRKTEKDLHRKELP